MNVDALIQRLSALSAEQRALHVMIEEFMAAVEARKREILAADGR